MTSLINRSTDWPQPNYHNTVRTFTQISDGHSKSMNKLTTPTIKKRLALRSTIHTLMHSICGHNTKLCAGSEIVQNVELTACDNKLIFHALIGVFANINNHIYNIRKWQDLIVLLHIMYSSNNV